MSASPAQAAIPVERYVLADDGRFPNSVHPVLVYRGALQARAEALALAFERLFAAHGWPPAWRAGLYSVHHYHATAHEVLGVFEGWVQARLGGEAGVRVTLRAGDAVLIPAGVAHCNEGQSEHFAAVGAYPRGMRPDMQLGREGERQRLEPTLARLPAPSPDPVLGSLIA